MADANDPVARRLREHRNRSIALLAERLTDHPGDGSPVLAQDPKVVADFVGSVIQGMSTRARDGATLEELTAVADLACAAVGVEPAASQ